MEPVAGNPHGGFCEGGRAQEAHSLKPRPYPPLESVPARPKTSKVRLPVIRPECISDVAAIYACVATAYTSSDD